MENTQKTWIQVWTENYLGQSDIARGITVKNNYKGNSYIGWAVMERCLSMLDPDSEIILETSENGGYVHTTRDILTTKKGDVITETEIIAHFVKVSVIFMTKKFQELFPIQDNSYAAVRAFDQNDINRSLQRAKAKVISRATGIGWALYESGDLQYELDAPKVTPPVAGKPLPPLTTTVNGQPVTAPIVGESGEDVEEAQAVYDLLHNAALEKAQPVLDFINKNLEKQYGKVITLENTFDEFKAVINVAAKPKLVLNAIKAQLAK